jgi:frataxin-like iron-binding protein CyaY
MEVCLVDDINQNDPQDREQVFNQLRSKRQVQARNKNDPDLNRKENVVAVRKNEAGQIIAIRTESGRELDYAAAFDEAKFENIKGLQAIDRNGKQFLTSEPDGYVDSLPSF